MRDEEAKAEETPEMIFERIRRRREARIQSVSETTRAHGESAHPAARAARAAAPMNAAQVASVPTTMPQPAGEVTLEGAVPAAQGEQFPRSATMRLLLRRPELALGLGLPAAGLLLRYPGSRRLIGAALRLGARADVQQAVQLSTALRHRARRAESPPKESASRGKPKPTDAT